MPRCPFRRGYRPPIPEASRPPSWPLASRPERFQFAHRARVRTENRRGQGLSRWRRRIGRAAFPIRFASAISGCAGRHPPCRLRDPDRPPHGSRRASALPALKEARTAIIAEIMLDRRSPRGDDRDSSVANSRSLPAASDGSLRSAGWHQAGIGLFQQRRKRSSIGTGARN